MVTALAFKERIYYDLISLSLCLRIGDDDALWIDKVLSLGHPEDWPDGVDYTPYVPQHKRFLVNKYQRKPEEVTVSPLNTIRQHGWWEIDAMAHRAHLATFRGIYGSIDGWNDVT